MSHNLVSLVILILPGVEKSDESNKQETANRLARLCLMACGRLAGYLANAEDPDTSPPDNPAVKKSLMAMLTPYLARKLSNPDPSEVSEQIPHGHVDPLPGPQTEQPGP